MCDSMCDGNLVTALCQEGSDRARRACVAETDVVPAGTRMMTEGKLWSPIASGSWVLEPLRGKKQEDKILMARKIVQGSRTQLPVRCMNHLEEDVILYKHTIGTHNKIARRE